MYNRYLSKSISWLNKLPDNSYREYLKDLTDKIVGREI